MKATCDTHLFGSRGGYRTVSSSPGVSARERSELEIFGFGQLSDRAAQQGLLQRAAAFGRRLASGRFAVTRILPGPDDDGGRPTLELRTVLLSREAYGAAARAGLALLLDTGALWSSSCFEEGGTLSVAIRQARSTAADDAHRRIADAWHGTRSNPSLMVRVAGEQESRVLDLASLLHASDLDDLRWGIGVLSTAVPVDLFTLSPHGSASGRRVVRDVPMAGAWRHPHIAVLPDHGPWPSLRATSAAASVASSGGEPSAPSEWTYTGPLPSFRRRPRRAPIVVAAAVLVIAVVVVVVLVMQATRPTGGGERVAHARSAAPRRDKEPTAPPQPPSTEGETKNDSTTDGGDGGQAAEKKAEAKEPSSDPEPQPTTASAPPQKDSGGAGNPEPAPVRDESTSSQPEQETKQDCDPEDKFETVKRGSENWTGYDELLSKLRSLKSACDNLNAGGQPSGGSSERSEGVLLNYFEAWKARPKKEDPLSKLNDLHEFPRVAEVPLDKLDGFVDGEQFVDSVDGKLDIPSHLCRQVEESITLLEGQIKHVDRLEDWLGRLKLDVYPESGSDKFKDYACRLQAFRTRWLEMLQSLSSSGDDKVDGKDKVKDAWSKYVEQRITGSWTGSDDDMEKAKGVIRAFLALKPNPEVVGNAVRSWINVVKTQPDLSGTEIGDELGEILGVKTR